MKSDGSDVAGAANINLDTATDQSSVFLRAGHLVQIDSFLATHGPCGRLFGTSHISQLTRRKTDLKYAFLQCDKVMAAEACQQHAKGCLHCCYSNLHPLDCKFFALIRVSQTYYQTRYGVTVAMMINQSINQ